MTCNRVTTSFRNTCSLSILAIALCAAGSANAGALPGRGHYVAGQGSIAKSGQVLTIDQSSRTGIINWKTFSIGKGNSVVFDNAHGATLNRVTGGNMSRIAGALHGAGSVYLINNSGVAVLPTGRIVTQGSFAASSRNADDGSFGVHKRLLFTGGAHGDVVNAGQITSRTGNVDLAGRNVSDSGSIAARNASVIGTDTARISGSIAANAVHGRGGNIETSGERVRLRGAAITGRAWLVDPQDLTVNAAAATTIKSSLNGGTNVTLKTTSTTASGPGVTSSGAGDIMVTAPLAWTGSGDLKLDAYNNVSITQHIAVNGSGGLTIVTAHGSAGGDLRFGQNGNVTFANLGTALTINGDAYTLVNSLSSLKNKIAADSAGHYALADSINAAAQGVHSAAIVPTLFQGTFEGLGNSISHLTIKDPTGSHVGLFGNVGSNGTLRDVALVGANIYGLADNAYTGGLAAINKGHITGASITGNVYGGYEAYTGGLVGYAPSSSRVSRSSSAANTYGAYESDVGGLIGENDGKVSDSHASGDVTAGYDSYVGGLVGYNDGDVDGSSASGNVYADYEAYVGGLIGYNYEAMVSNSHATGDVFGGYDSYTGGLIGYNDEATIFKSFASGDVTADYESSVGGLVGYEEEGAIKSSHASGTVNSGYDSYAGGLAGYTYEDSVKNAYATGDVTGDDGEEGGLIGETEITTLSNTHATGNVNGGYSGYSGGLIGYEDGTTPITDSYATGNVTGGDDDDIGGLVGYVDDAASPIVNSYATGKVSGGESTYVGGLVGYNDGSDVTDSYATGHAFGGEDSYVGGLVGFNYEGTIKNSHASGKAETGYEYYVGGLVGEDDGGTIISSYATGAVNGGAYSYAGGLVGYAEGDTIKNSYAKGKIFGGYESYTGGLAGYADSGATVKNSYATGRVLAQEYSYQGGLIGDNAGVIFESYATGQVIGGYDGYVGGLVGYSDGSINKSFATGDVSGNDNYMGGFAGENDGVIARSYSRGDVTGSEGSYAGGFVGYNDTGGTINQAYSTGYVVNDPASGYTGGFVGYDDAASGNITNAYWDKQTSNVSDPTKGAGNIASDSGILGRTTAQLMALPGGLSSMFWKVSASLNDGLPILKDNLPPN